MKLSLLRTFTFLLGSGLLMYACYPPRPHENETLKTASSGGSSSLLGTGGRVDFAEGGMGGRGSGPEPVPVPEEVCPYGPDPSLSFSKKNLLLSVGKCATVRACEFQAWSLKLAQESEGYAEDLEASALGKVRSTYLQALLSWSRSELFRFGPAASAANDMAGGQGLRDLIYSWPFVSRCRVEEQTFGKDYQTYGFDNLVKVPINSRGLFAVEYLAFYEGTDNACSQFSVTNAGDAWANTSSEDLQVLKAQYLQAVSLDVHHRANLLFDAWDPEKGNYTQKLSEAEGYMSVQQALNIVAHALLYVEVEVKDYKVGHPAGLYADAPVERPELSFALGATDLLAQNLRGFEDVFVGCDGEGLGFDDWLVEAGHGDLAADMIAALAGARSAVEEFPDLSQASQEELTELHAVIKVLTDLLKSEFFGQGSPLGLTLPTSVEGDTD